MNKFLSTRFIYPFLLMALISAALHWRVFHYEIGGIHAWRQTQTQQSTLNFYRFDPNILNSRTNILTKELEPTIQRYEFPVMQWTMGMIYHVTGDSIFVTRLLMFLLGLCTIAGVYYWIKQFFNNKLIALTTAWAFSYSPVFFYYCMNTLPDLLALSGTVWSLAFFFRIIQTGSRISMVASALCISIAVAAKLPYIIFLAPQGVWWIWSLFRKRFKNIRPEIAFAVVNLICIAPVIWWYAWVIPTWSNGVIPGIFENQVSMQEVKNILRYHAKVMFPSLLLGYLALIFLFVGAFFAFKKKTWKDPRFWWLFVMGIIVFFYWIYEFNMIGIVHDYYMMPFLPILYFVVAYGIKQVMGMKSWIKIAGIALLLAMPIYTYYITRDFWSVKYIPEFQDVYNYSKDLRKAAPDGSNCIILNDGSGYIFSYLVDKQGWVFNNDYLPGGWVEDMILNYDATYMYSISRKVEEDPEVSKYLDKLVMEWGNVRVFQLKQLNK